MSLLDPSTVESVWIYGGAPARRLVMCTINHCPVSKKQRSYLATLLPISGLLHLYVLPSYAAIPIQLWHVVSGEAKSVDDQLYQRHYLDDCFFFADVRNP